MRMMTRLPDFSSVVDLRLVDLRVAAPGRATILANVLAGDEGGIVRGQKQYAVGDVFHLGQPTQWIGFARLAQLGGHLVKVEAK